MNLDIASGQCMNQSVPQNVSFGEQGGILDSAAVVVPRGAASWMSMAAAVVVAAIVTML